MLNKRAKIIKDILFEPEIQEKYKLTEEDLTGMYRKKIVDVLETIVNENDNGRTGRQIYPVIKNIHKI
ncbi:MULTISPECIES: hypothetical protein [Psychroflexus]|uniref:Uncharacterized protein n=1 Tax=Psychroflexus longus TaxID=2873596 RepID=A0ABS7XLM5_9FLAO|nr:MULTISPECIES: hypothetical protein [Psychroflexus]MBZ9650992.1 hypothetical protein [Psychroflexus montanilacus]MBZ9779892.1 hypothetical protein [Psychroflexus longus]